MFFSELAAIKSRPHSTINRLFESEINIYSTFLYRNKHAFNVSLHGVLCLKQLHRVRAWQRKQTPEGGQKAECRKEHCIC